jgi:sugar lactone lactonase YvrE
MTSPSARVFLSAVDHAEGVAWNPRTREVVFSTEGGKLYSVGLGDGASPHLLSAGGGFLLGVTVDSSGDIYACDMTRHCVWRWNAVTKESTVFARGTTDRPMRIPNYAVMKPDGSLWVSDSGSCWDAADGLIWSIQPDGTCTPATSEPLSFPNGMALSPDGGHLYVLETFPPALKRLPVNDSEILGAPELVTELPGTVPDGLAFTDDGDMLIGCYRPDQVIRVSGGQEADVSVVFADPTGRLLAGSANLCFAGTDLDRLIVSNVGGNHLTELEAGLRGSPVGFPEAVS